MPNKLSVGLTVLKIEWNFFFTDSFILIRFYNKYSCLSAAYFMLLIKQQEKLAFTNSKSRGSRTANTPELLHNMYISQILVTVEFL